MSCTKMGLYTTKEEEEEERRKKSKKIVTEINTYTYYFQVAVKGPI